MPTIPRKIDMNQIPKLSSDPISMKLLAQKESSDFLRSPPQQLLHQGLRLNINDLEESLTQPLKQHPAMISVTDEGKQVVVPSMGTIGEILLHHLRTIRQLEKQVGKLRLALDSL